jgi:2Fe-2S ferredoxin
LAKVIFIEKGGTAQTVEAVAGLSVADAALNNAVPGIEADCGGSCACATCHVYVEDGWINRLTPPDELEAQMLGFAFDVRPNSRLSCQIKLSDALDGLVVRVPERQY